MYIPYIIYNKWLCFSQFISYFSNCFSQLCAWCARFVLDFWHFLIWTLLASCQLNKNKLKNNECICLKWDMNSFSTNSTHPVLWRVEESDPRLERERARETEREREREQTPSDELYSICQLSVDWLLEVPKGLGSLKFHPYAPNQSLIYGIIRCNSFALCAHVTMSHKSFGLGVSPLSFPYFLTFPHLFNCVR